MSPLAGPFGGVPDDGPISLLPDLDAQLLDQAATPPHEHPFPGNELVHIPYFGESSDDPHHADNEKRTVVDDVELAVCVSSKVDRATYKPALHGDQLAMEAADRDGEDLHRPVIDLDFDAKLLPSSTPGHWHLYLDRAMPWSTYQHLLTTLAQCGIVESGYDGVAIRRKATHVRVPWLRKGDRVPPLPAPAIEPVETGLPAGPVENPHDCLIDPASLIPFDMDMPDLGPREDGERTSCAVCDARWVLREVAGFICWQPVPVP